MKDPSELECMTQDEIDAFKEEIHDIVKSFTKNEIVSVKGMVLPPMFTFNVLKLSYMILLSDYNS